MGVERRELVEREVERLHEEASKLARDWSRVPWLFGTIVLVPLMQVVSGPGAAMLALIFVPSLVATSAYLIGVRRKENAQLIEDLEQQLREYEQVAR